MFPVLFSLGSVTIYTFGFFLAVGFLLNAFILWRRLRDLGIDEEKTIDFIILSGLLAILLFWLLSFLEKESFSNLAVWGGILAIFLILAWFAKKEKWNAWRIADETIFALLPFLVLFELGLFFDGRSPGKPTSMPWGIYFPGSLVRSQPVSLFSALAFFLLWLFLLRIERRWRLWSWYKSKNNGFITLVFLILGWGTNLVVAFWRRSTIYWYWTEIGLSSAWVLVGLVLFYSRSGRRLKKESSSLTQGRFYAQKESSKKARSPKR